MGKKKLSFQTKFRFFSIIMSCHEYDHIFQFLTGLQVFMSRDHISFHFIPVMFNTQTFNKYLMSKIKNQEGEETVEVIDFKAVESLLNHQPVKRKQKPFDLGY